MVYYKHIYFRISDYQNPFELINNILNFNYKLVYSLSLNKSFNKKYIIFKKKMESLCTILNS